MLCSPMCVCCIQEEDEVPDDETVNQMIARSEEEFDQFMVSVSKDKLHFIQTHVQSIQVFIFSPNSKSLHLCISHMFSSSPSPSVWTWTGGVRRPVTRGVNLV